MSIPMAQGDTRERAVFASPGEKLKKTAALSLRPL
jgi:hypothetical protein